jgi:hypothetical protein
MGALQFLASLISSLAWPITVTVLVFVLRVPLTRVLLTLTRLKYKDFELDFGRDLKRLEEDAKAVGIAPKDSKAIAPPRRDSLQLLEEAARIAQEFPEAAISIAWQAVEAELIAAVMRLAMSPDYPSYNSALKNAELLRDQNMIDTRTFEILNRMRVLRNAAIHGARSATAITSDEASEFVALARGVVEKLQTLRR